MRAMLELASHDDTRPLSMEVIADNRNISRKYLHALLTSLRSAGLVRSVRGPGGGYQLAKAPEDISISAIMKALEGPLAPANCVDEPESCERSNFCPMVGLWNEVNVMTERLLDGISLADMAARERTDD